MLAYAIATATEPLTTILRAVFVKSDNFVENLSNSEYGMCLYLFDHEVLFDRLSSFACGQSVSTQFF